MKKIILSGVAVISLTAAMAQTPYVNVSVGYGLGIPGEKLGTNSTTASNGDKTAENVYGTLGQGLSFGITPGYFFNEHIGAEIGFNYFMGSEVEVQTTATPYGTATVTANSNQMRMTPSLVLRTGSEGLYAYAKTGIVMPLGGTTYTKIDDTGAAGPNTANTSEFETKGAFSWGFSGALGVNYSINEMFSVFGEANAVHLRINAKTRTMTAATSNGVDVMGALTTYDKEITYQDELNNSSNNSSYNTNYSTATAKDDLRTRNNFGALFLNIGLKINF